MPVDSQSSFTQLGNTVVVAANTSAPTGVQAAVSATFAPRAPENPQGAGQYRIVNSGTVLVHLGVGKSAAEAQTNAVAAAAGSPALGIPLLPSTIEVLRFDNDAFFSGVSATAATVYVTPGQGL